MKRFIWKVIFCLIMCFCFITSSVNATTEREKNAASQLNGVGIIKGRDNGDLALTSNITRAEMATLILRVTSQENIPISNLKKSGHTDIKGHWAEDNIRRVISLGYMKGYTDTEFAPNDLISYAEVVTLVIRLIGEEQYVKGTWPLGEIERAKKVGILKNETLYDSSRYAEKLTRGTVALLLYDTMILNTNAN